LADGWVDLNNILDGFGCLDVVVAEVDAVQNRGMILADLTG
jgi:hypothetical protein